MTEDRPELPDTPNTIRDDGDRPCPRLEQGVSEPSDRIGPPARVETAIHRTARGGQHRTADNGPEVDDIADRAATQAGQLIDNPAPSVSDPLEDVGKQVADSTRRNRVPIATITGVSAAVLTWIILRRRRS
ncbi:hypothetical protein [Nocardia sp. CA-119907]|uniref:hypothetical protein n=1 Tax=Nocardia sp. CA-119907 TaxID=3239973 RepID=UPI003D988473